VENVASMHEAARKQVRPIKTLPMSRPRLAWCSEELYEMEDLHLGGG
jgi:hypothetical protein